MTQINDIHQHCQSQGIKLTPLRKKVIEILNACDSPISAYALLEQLKQCHPTANIMSVYRILNFLEAHQLVHKIDNTNHYTLCCHPSSQICQLLVCQQCHQKFEIHTPEIDTLLQQIASEHHFQLMSNKIVLSGYCHHCQIQTQ